MGSPNQMRFLWKQIYLTKNSNPQNQTSFVLHSTISSCISSYSLTALNILKWTEITLSYLGSCWTHPPANNFLCITKFIWICNNIDEYVIIWGTEINNWNAKQHSMLKWNPQPTTVFLIIQNVFSFSIIQIVL